MPRFIGCLTALVATTPPAGRAQTPAPRPGIVVLNLRFDGEHANVLEPGDTNVARAATSRLLATLRGSEHVTVVDSGAVATAVAVAETDGNRCDRACARSVARQLGARWLAGGVVVKTSNLVWILRAELVDVASGQVVLADSYELKGDARRMGPAGAHVFAQRIERAIAQPPAVIADPPDTLVEQRISSRAPLLPRDRSAPRAPQQ